MKHLEVKHLCVQARGEETFDCAVGPSSIESAADALTHSTNWSQFTLSEVVRRELPGQDFYR